MTEKLQNINYGLRPQRVPKALRHDRKWIQAERIWKKHQAAPLMNLVHLCCTALLVKQ
jgi:hypothetical protein